VFVFLRNVNRRFVRAAQAGFKMPSLNLEFLGNFLAELTLMEYSFLPYLPSLVAASAVFMAKLTLDSSTHPWVCRSPSSMPTSFDSR
jgi:cyclin A